MRIDNMNKIGLLRIKENITEYYFALRETRYLDNIVDIKDLRHITGLIVTYNLLRISFGGSAR